MIPSGTRSTSTGPIDISVVIVNWNTRDLLVECLRSVSMQEIAPLTAEIIVVDNGSLDGSVESVRQLFSDVRIIENKYPRGFTKAANQGLALSQGRYILLTQPDVTLMEARSVATMTACLDQNLDISVVVPRYVNPDGSFQRMYNGFPTLGPMCFLFSPLIQFRVLRRLPAMRRYFLDEMDFERPGDVPQPGLSCAVIRKESLWQVGLLDEQFPLYFSDVDWCLRLRACGLKIQYLPGVRVVHLRGASTNKMGEHQWMHSVGSLVRYFRKHKSGIETRILQMALFANLMAEKFRLNLGKIRHGQRFGPQYRLLDIWTSIRGRLPSLDMDANCEKLRT